MLKHWVLSLLDRGRRFTTGNVPLLWKLKIVALTRLLGGFAGESLVVALSKQAVFTRLFTGLQPAEARATKSLCIAERDDVAIDVILARHLIAAGHWQ
jgi:hypothetical protein